MKKKSKKKVSKAKPAEESVGTCIEDALLQQLLRRDAELKNTVLSLKVAQLEQEIKDLKWIAEHGRLSDAVLEAKKNFQQVTEEVESQYDIDMKNHAYDPDTGLLMSLDQ